MSTHAEKYTPILSEKEYIALEIAKVMIAGQNCQVPTSVAQVASKAAHALIECCKEF